MAWLTESDAVPFAAVVHLRRRRSRANGEIDAATSELCGIATAFESAKKISHPSHTHWAPANLEPTTVCFRAAVYALMGSPMSRDNAGRRSSTGSISKTRIRKEDTEQPMLSCPPWVIAFLADLNIASS